MRKALYLLPLLAFCVLVAWFALALRPNYDPQTLPSAMIDQPAPAFDLAALNGGANLSLSGLKGQVVLVNFFASWCAPCLEEAGVLGEIAKRGLPIWGITYKDEPAATRSFLAQNGDPYARIAMDRPGRVAIDWGVYGVPETYFIDGGGIVRWRYAGALTDAVVQRDILPLWHGAAASTP